MARITIFFYIMKLTVKPLKQKHAQRSIAMIDVSYLDNTGINNGDYIRIINPNKEDKNALARAQAGYNEDKDRGIIRIDGQKRSEADASIDENVIVEKADLSPADEIKISIPSNYNIKGNVGDFIRQEINGEPIQLGQTIPFSLDITGIKNIGSTKYIPLDVVETEPENDVVVTDETNIDVVESSNIRSNEQAYDSAGMITYEDIGGLNDELEKVREMIELPMRHPELFARLGIDPPKGLLLHGSPGTGKTLIARAVANEVDAEFFTISGPEIMSKYYGESEEQLREVFEEASDNSPSIIFMDELDSIASQRGESNGDVERRVVAQLLSLMDGLEDRDEVIVIGATNRVDAIDPALRRGGRFDREIEVTAPDKQGRKEIFDVHTRNMPLENIDLNEYAEKTHGFVGADIEALCKESAMTALRRIKPELDLEEDSIESEVLDDLNVVEDDFKESLKNIEPSALREVFVEVPNVNWNDVGGLEDTKTKMREMVQWPLNYEEVFEDMNLESAKGVLLYGPPGTGKTQIAKAVANESESNFISIKGPELLNKYVGESEKGVREIFEKARSNAPTVVFFDEIDALATERGGGENNVGERVVSQLLTELDGLENLEDVVVIATTNRPDLIDSALIRPGRLDRHIHVPIPDKKARKSILEVHTRDVPTEDGLDLDKLAEKTENYVGADLEALVREATMESSRSLIKSLDPDEDSYEETQRTVTMENFEHALNEVQPTATENLKEEYEQIEETFETNNVSQQDKRGFQ